MYLRFSIAVLILTFLIRLLPAQTLSRVQLDSLEQIANGAQGEKRLTLYLRLVEGYLNLDLDKASLYSEQGAALAMRLQNPMLIIRAFDMRGKTLFEQGRYQTASTNFQKGLNAAEQLGEPFPISILSNSMGVLKRQTGEYEEALLHFQRSLGLYQDMGAIPPQLSVMVNIGGLHLLLEQYDKAILILKEAFQLADQNGFEQTKGVLSANLGAAYEGKGNYQEALKYYEEVLQINQLTGSPGDLADGLSRIYSLLSTMGEPSLAQPYYQRAWLLVNEHKLINQKKVLLIEKGKAHQRNRQWGEARSALEEALELANQKEYQDQTTVLELEKMLADISAIQGDYSTAYRYLDHYEATQAKLYKENLDHSIDDLEQRFALQRRLEEADEELRRAQAFSEQQRLKLYGMLGAVMLIVIALVALYSRFRIKKRAHLTLSQQNDAIQQQNQLLAFKNEEIQTQNDLLAEQSEAIRRQNHLLQQSNTDLEQFAYAASHDLREPLRTIRSYMQLLERRYTEVIDDSGREFIRFAVDGATRMDILLKDLLEYSRIGRSGMLPDWVDMNTVLSNVLQNLSRQISDNQAVVHLGEMPRIKGYETELYLLFQNLLSNALKFHGQNKISEVRIQMQEYADNYVFSVSDNGIGIPAEYKETIFSIFQRLHTRNDYEGTGIGLAICKKVVASHQGEIWVESQVGKGASFFIRLPKR